MEKINFVLRVFNWFFFHLTKGNRLFPYFLRYKGIKLGKNIFWGDFKTITIDFTRPSLVEIGDDVRINTGFTLMTHDGANMVLRRVYHEYIPCSGRVKIGNNVYFGRQCTVLKGVTIGDNCIIGYGSLVTRDIPANSVAVGRPAKVISSLDDYYQRRKVLCKNEAMDYARSIQERFGRRPELKDFWEEFPLFLEGDEEFAELPIRSQLNESYDYYRENNKPVFHGLEDFLKQSGI